jgi:spermidine/putrescine-binding protein
MLNLRRLSQALLCAAPLTLGAVAADAKQELRVVTFEGYAEPSWIKPFEEKFDAEVKTIYIGSNDEYMAKLAADGGKGEFDIVLVVSSLAQPAINAGFVEPLDLSLLPNLNEQFDSLKNIAFNQKDGKTYGVCIFWGTAPMTVNADVIPADAGYGVLFDPKYAGKLAMWDDISSIADVAVYLGYDNVWDLSDEQLEEVKKVMIAQKPLLRKYWTRAGELIELFQTGEIVAANSWNYITNTLQAANFNAREILNDPPVSWIDNYFIAKGSPNVELAHAFINYIISAETQAKIAEHTGYTVCNPQSKAYMDPKVWDHLYMEEADQILSNSIMWEEIPRRDKYNQVWNEIKSAN